MKKIISILFILCGIFSSMAYAQGGLTYSGTVIGEDGLELIGVSVAVKGTSIGVITDIDGKFTLNDVPEAGVSRLVISATRLRKSPLRTRPILKWCL